jgi:uncharacterized membrane protein
VKESHLRSLAKAVSYRVAGSLATLAIAYAFTGNLVISGSVAGTDALSKIALYYLHERLWDRVRPT